jgi:anhydro-N-acetylmuramic acid kinase
MEEEQLLTVLGLMSGSSLDGLDLAICSFTSVLTHDGFQLKEWSLNHGATIPYPPTWKARLRSAPHLPGRELWRLHADLGRYFGQVTKKFIAEQGLDINLIGSHGHTVFHDPSQHFTAQIGDGAAIAALTGLPVVDQLRTADIFSGGQGAPIAPIADKYLFPEYGAFLNLGGIANVCCKVADGQLLAGDVSGANQILDLLAETYGKPYDAGGEIARSGKYLPDLAEQLKALPYHHLPCPKSLDNGWVREKLWPLINIFPAEAKDRMHTFCRFLAEEIHSTLLELATTGGLPPQPIRVLITGGGTHNHFFLECLRSLPQNDKYPFGYEAAEPQIADLKEAALVALCALLRYRGQPNALATATGADRDTINGALYLPKP